MPVAKTRASPRAKTGSTVEEGTGEGSRAAPADTVQRSATRSSVPSRVLSVSFQCRAVCSVAGPACGGKPVNGPGRDRGVVFQSFALFPWRTVLENVAFGPKMRGIGKAERDRIAHEYLALAKLTEAAERYPNELSGGMQQRVGVARALANEPDVLLMDEPFASVDAQTRMTLQEELTRIWGERRPTVLFITHDVNEAVFLANRVVVLSRGSVLDDIAIDLPRPRAWDALIEDAAFKSLAARVLQRVRAA